METSSRSVARPTARPDWQLRVLHTPGHARGHLTFVESRYRAALVGDLMSGVSTILIDPPEGHLATYLRSLERLLAEPILTVYPAHGPPHRDGHAMIRQLLAHRARPGAAPARRAPGRSRVPRRSSCRWSMPTRIHRRTASPSARCRPASRSSRRKVSPQRRRALAAGRAPSL
jgi:glyoxylase-like metal-dependent hydrolase (beta-lactamase superfamily II)